MLRFDAQARAQRAFGIARRKAFLRHVMAVLQGRSNRLLAFEEVRERLHVGGPIYRGVQSVPVRQIIGSVNRYHDFDRVFLPSQDFTSARWRSIGRAFYQEISLPPVKLYKVGEVYFAVDGNHRVSVAREMGQEFIDAEVQECSVRVPITPDLAPEDLEIIGEKAEFLQRTGLDQIRPQADISLTIAGGYYALLEHIAVHRYLQSVEWQREFAAEEAAAQWYDQVYWPMIQSIRKSNILDDFPGRTEADLYLWVMEHRYYLRERFGPGISAWEAVRSYSEHFTQRTFKRLWRWLTHHFPGGGATSPTDEEPK
jgi:hypothetical protein